VTRTDVVEVDLRNRLQALIRRDGAITRDLRAGHDDDWTEQAIERENDVVLEGLDDATRAEVVGIRRALDRIRRGQYGICDVCHTPIAHERLRAMPTATVCVACQASRRMTDSKGL
jgi:DnaK suppressor protein